MLRLFINQIGRSFRHHETFRHTRRLASSWSISGGGGDNDDKDEALFRDDLDLPGVTLDEIDKIMANEALQPLSEFYPKTDVKKGSIYKPMEGHQLMVIQPWVSYANFDENTGPDLQLEECVSLGNTIHNWHVVDKRIVFAHHVNRKHLLGPKAFEELKDTIMSISGVSAVFFGVECLSAIQLGTLERELKLAVYDRFTVVLNIFRQHARTKEARLQIALAELPYIKSHLREIHESTEYSSSSESMKLLVGGVGESYYHRRLNILKRREARLRMLLDEIRRQRDLTKRSRKKTDIPTVAIVGYTNSGKTSLIKYLTQDERLVPKDQLFATLDVSVHKGQLPSNKSVFYLDTVGFLSRIPTLLIEAFSTTLKDVQESDLIVHILDVTHPDHKLQYTTVIDALQSLKIPKQLFDSRVTVGNKADLLHPEADLKKLPKCDLSISATNGTNLRKLVEMLDTKLLSNLRRETFCIRVENGGKRYSWLRKFSTILEATVDETDGNYLICRVIMSPAATGRYYKQFGSDDVRREGEAVA